MTVTITLISFLLTGTEYGESEAACKLEKNKKTIKYMQLDAVSAGYMTVAVSGGFGQLIATCQLPATCRLAIARHSRKLQMHALPVPFDRLLACDDQPGNHRIGLLAKLVVGKINIHINKAVIFAEKVVKEVRH